jgi:hypothetical protein
MPRKKPSPLFSSEEKPIKIPVEKPKVKKKVVSPKAEKPTKIPMEKPKEEKKPISPKAEKPKRLPSSPPKKEIPLKVKSVKKEDPVEEVKEVKNEIPKETPKRKEIKRGKKEEPKNIKHKLKVGQKVMVTFLGSPTEGIIIDLTSEGTYKVKSDRGIIFPRAKILNEGEVMDRYYPSYIIKVLNQKK